MRVYNPHSRQINANHVFRRKVVGKRASDFRAFVGIAAKPPNIQEKHAPSYCVSAAVFHACCGNA